MGSTGALHLPLMSAKGIQQVALRARIHKRAVIMLAMDFGQRIGVVIGSAYMGSDNTSRAACSA